MNPNKYVFQSKLADEMVSHIALKRALGRKYESEERILRQLDRFLARRCPKASDLSLRILREWLAEHSLQPATRATWLTIVRQFCLYQRRSQPSVYVPNRKNARSIWPTRIPRYRPHIYTQAEVKKLLGAVLQLASTPSNPFRPQTFFTLFLLLYATGLRVSEALKLQWGDVDWAAGTILVRESKFYKTRVVPLHKEMLESLWEYRRVLARSNRGGESGKRLPLFQRAGRRGYKRVTVGHVWLGLVRQCNVKAATGRKGPRLHDLRHNADTRIIPSISVSFQYQRGFCPVSALQESA